MQELKASFDVLPSLSAHIELAGIGAKSWPGAIATAVKFDVCGELHVSGCNARPD